MSYLTLAGPGEAETRVLGSRFLAIALPVRLEPEARAQLESRTRTLFDASHHCSAWRLHGGVWRANDAGEPSGSAGVPVLAAIDAAGVEDCLVIVTRYFGGTKLGVGGLIRAYGDAAGLALAAAPRREAVTAFRFRIRYRYDHTAAVMRALERAGAVDVEYGFAGEVGEVSFSAPDAAQALLVDSLREETAGAVAPERLGERVLYRAHAR